MEKSGAREKNSNHNYNTHNRWDNLPQRSFKDHWKKTPPKSKKRQFPIGKRELERLLEIEPHLIPVTLLTDGSGYSLLLDLLEIKRDTLCLLIKILHKSLNTRAFADGTRDLLLLTFTNSKFLHNLNQFISCSKYEVEHLLEYLPLICEIIDNFLTLSPMNAFPVASGFVDTCVGVITHIKPENKSDMESVEKYLQTLQLKIKESRASYKKFKAQSSEAPPDNFRELDVVPTATELNAVARPFIRPNIIEGSYENLDHYLDVQFRLLKEDFMGPLREGLKHYRTDCSKHADVRVYSNVTLHSTNIEKTELVHYLFINGRRKFFLDTSKRFMYGNIICISDDNFQTVTTASVFNRDRLKENLVGVKIEAESASIHYDKAYVAIESKAYFVSYKHTLKVLQNLTDIPFEDYIVFVNEVDKEPQYIKDYKLHLHEILRADNCKNITRSDCDRDLNSVQRRQILESRDSIDTITCGSLIGSIIDIFNISSDLLLNMDESQQRALNAALSRQVAIIQGPPGTGKTFLGLQITEILLRENKLWNKNNSRPILVVCYTNHALDQFLEGILRFTYNIIRFGSQSKRETLRRYDIKNCVSQSEGRIGICPITNMYHNVRLKIKLCEARINNITEIINELDNFNIVGLSSFTCGFDILPPHIVNALTSADMDMMQFLRAKFIYRDIYHLNKIIKRPSVENPISKKDLSLSLEDELMKREEHERMLDDQNDDDDEELRVNEDNGNEKYDYDYDDDDDNNEYYEKRLYLDILISRSQLIDQLRHLYSSDKLQFSEMKRMERDIKINLAILTKIQEVNIDENKCALLENEFDLYDLNFEERVQLYCYWRSKLRLEYEKLKQVAIEKFMNLHGRLLSLRQLAYLEQMQRADIIGMTTTGAAQYCNLLHDLAPPIVIVEEAAEILEAHVISSLSSKCEHLIMIGDHQQLRPKPTVYELGKKYHLDTSLFERLIKNGIKYETLECQHRMKPTISELLVPTFYENLKDHSSVLEYPKIRGVKEDLFFISHSKQESKPIYDNESFENPHEAQFLLRLCKHLVYQGYTEKDITIITPYSGQFRCIRELQRNEDMIQNIPVSILDNFQGEESNIILLSLVRSNEDENIGFMKIDNRICVAISRAKHGMYIIGNMNQMIKSSSIWSNINQKLVNKNCVGYSLRLVCQNHPDVSITVNSYEEFNLESPEGGCNQMCGMFISECGHACPRYCHPDDRCHTDAKCQMSCPKFLCKFNHTKCTKLCCEDCPKCITPVEKEFACGHKHLLECSSTPLDFECPTIVDKVLRCNHVAKNVECHVYVRHLICTDRCLKILNCGHHCEEICHKFKCKEHYLNDKSCTSRISFRVGFEQVCPDCKMVVEKQLSCGHKYEMKCNMNPKDFLCCQKIDKKLPCGHEVNIECHVDVTLLKCLEPCSETLTCGHICDGLCHCTSDPDHKTYNCKKECLKFPENCNLHKCMKLCFEECKNCIKLIDWSLECGHVMKGMCGGTLDQIICLGKCQRILPCGHPCPRKCGEDCGGCMVTVENIIPECLHSVMVGCEVQPCIELCKTPCTKLLRCGHVCQNSCNERCTVSCKMMIASNKKCPRSHTMKIQCHLEIFSGDIAFPLLGDYLDDKCMEVCGLTLDCNHKCKGKCGQCFSGRLHVPCTNICNKALACGHKCKAICSDECPPCRENCLWKCVHMKCEDNCGDRCSTICDIPCPNSCNHSTCSARCGSRCDRKPCRLPCDLKIAKCDHLCVGFCGEPCPLLCKICDRDKIEELLFGDVTIEHARFIMLEDCNHTFESNFLDTWMYTKSKGSSYHGTKMKTCPECGEPIYNTRRYRSRMMNMYQQISTSSARKRIMNQEWFRGELLGLSTFWPDEATAIKENLGFDNNFSISGKKYMDSSLLDLYDFQVNFLKFASRMKEKSWNKTELKILINLAMTYEGRMNLKKREQFFYEIRRLKNCDILMSMRRRSVDDKVQENIRTIENLMDPTVVFSEEIEKQIKQLFNEGWMIINRSRVDRYPGGHRYGRGGYNSFYRR